MNTGVKIDEGRMINCLLYADDIALIAKNHRDAQILVDQAQLWADTHGLTINAEKTEYLVLNAMRAYPIRLAGVEVKP